MSKRQLKSQASSARAAAAAAASGFGTSSAAFGSSSSQLSHVTEPPDLSSISDPNVVVYFRNLSKKDSTTKAKALEELQTYISSLQEPVEDGVLEAWVGPMHGCEYEAYSNINGVDPNVSTYRNRQRKVCASKCTFPTGSHGSVRWQKNSKTHAQGRWGMAFGPVRH